MARILVYTSPARGHLFPVSAILDVLVERGHSIAIRTLGSEVARAATRGFDSAPVDPRIESIEHDDWGARTPTGALKRGVRVFGARGELDGPDLENAIRDVRPDAVIVDINCWGAAAAAESWGGPWATFCPYPLPLGSRDAPPFGPGLPPARGPLGRARDRLLRPLVVGPYARQALPPVNAARSSFGLGPVATADEFLTRPPLVLYLTAEPFEYPRSDWPANVALVGPCEVDPPADPPDWLKEVERPIVLVTSSSEFQDDARLVETALTALADEEVFVVATVPAHEPPRFQVPDNARVESFVAHTPLLERAVCAITHGGMGATQKALAHGVPVCVVPFGRDQLEVARRVAVAGAGTRLPARRLRADRLRDAFRQAVTCADGARRVAQGFAAAGGAQAAASLVEERLVGLRGAARVTG
ncbi:MAG TPA: glycosyltransferase [Thermoleophilaceae bacterium]|nr:glycosyltransferase [Thermoleophilaceae bacterium]